ncbi:MAG: hypothetical protein IJX49_04455 [Clostridia bacterium]|nr:hypothetical protein [Clostridia bacterium]
MSDVKRIGIRYDHTKFDAAIQEAAKAYLENVMGAQAQTESGQDTVVKIADSAMSLLSKLPVEYYQMLEAYVDGKPMSDFAEINEKAVGFSNAVLSEDRGLVALIAACSMGSWKVKDPKGAEAYYNGLFPEPQAQVPNPAMDLPKTRAEAEARAKAKWADETAKGKRGAIDIKAQTKANEKAYKAYMSALKKRDRAAYDKLSAVHKQEKKEQKKLIALNAKIAKHNEKFGYLNELAQINPDKSLFTPKELKKYDRLRREERELVRKKDDYADSLDRLNLQRFESGLITQRHYEMRASQLLTADFTYTPMSSGEQLAESGQTTLGSMLRRDSEEEMRRTFEEERARVSLQAELEAAMEFDEEILAADEVMENLEHTENWDRRQPIEEMYDEMERDEEIVDADDLELE